MFSVAETTLRWMIYLQDFNLFPKIFDIQQQKVLSNRIVSTTLHASLSSWKTSDEANEIIYFHFFIVWKLILNLNMLSSFCKHSNLESNKKGEFICVSNKWSIVCHTIMYIIFYIPRFLFSRLRWMMRWIRCEKMPFFICY